jgi:hypothetical protein
MVIPFPPFAYHRVSGLDDQRIVLSLLAAFIGILLLTLLLWPVAALVRRHYRRPLSLGPRERRLRLWSRLAVLLQVLCLAGWGTLLAVGVSDFTLFSQTLDKWLRLLQAATLLGAVAALPAVAHAIRAWRSRKMRIWSKLRETLIALGCLGFVCMVWVGRLLSFSLRY